MAELRLWLRERGKEDLFFKLMKKEYSRRKTFEKVRDEFESRLLDLARVTRVTKGGKRLRFRAVVIVGNKRGKAGGRP